MRKSSNATRVFGVPVVPPVSNTNTGLPASPFGIQRCTGPPRSHSSSNRPELREIAEAADLPPRVPPELLRVIEPERTAGRGIEVPVHDLAHPGVERGLRRRRIRNGMCAGHRHKGEV